MVSLMSILVRREL